MSESRADIRQGRESPTRWRYRPGLAASPVTTSVRARDGRLLVKEPVGFEHAVLLRGADGALSEAALLRLMKALSLAVHTSLCRQPGRAAIERIEVQLDPAIAAPAVAVLGAGDPSRAPRLSAQLSPNWWRSTGEALAEARAAIYGLVSAALGRAGDAIPRRSESVAPPSPPEQLAGAKVLLFTNPFASDMDPSEATQINPGMHYLISALHQRGATTVLCEAKQPLQQVCDRPPDVEQPLSPAEFITHAEAFEALLAEHPDLNLVCLTVLERSFAQIRELCRFIHARSHAFIAVGGVFPSHAPEHCFVHLPEVSFVVRGDGERLLPLLAGAVAGRGREEGLDEASLEMLAACSGVMVRAGEVRLAARPDRINRVTDLDSSSLDWSVAAERHLRQGASLSTSRGCVYGCRFCSVPERHLWRAKSAGVVNALLDAYVDRLVEIYGSPQAVPAAARRLKLWDDDFFLDADRAVAILCHMVERGLSTSFVQGTVASFFHRQGRKASARLNHALIEAIPTEAFSEAGGLKIGTESFCDRELGRLGKPYRYTHIRGLVQALAQRGLKQDHYLILCNRDTTLDDLMESFENIAELRWLAGNAFQVLSPSWLMSLWPTVLYQAEMLRGGEDALPHAGVLRLSGYPELDYRFVLPQRPARDEVYEVVRRFPSGMHFGAAGAPADEFDGVYEEADADYLAIFRHLRRLLEVRLAEIGTAGASKSGQGAAEIFRIEAALGRLGPPRWVPEGLVRRLAPRLRIVSQSEDVERLARYLDNSFATAVRDTEAQVSLDLRATTEGVMVTARHQGVSAELLVERRHQHSKAAFFTRNLAFVVRAPLGDEARRRRVEPLLRAVQLLAERADAAPLD